MQFPLTSLKSVYHVGQLEGQPAVGARHSLEGPCLSVSTVPEAWREIARLGDSPVWKLAKRNNRFLNVYAMSPEHQTFIQQWGLEHGYITRGPGWLTEMDGEDESGVRTAISETIYEAIRNWGEVGEESVIGHSEIEVNFATEKLHQFAHEQIPLLLVSDMLLIAFAERELVIDGVLWEETLDVASLSAPRAGIFAGRLPSWTVTRQTSAN